MKHYPDQPLVNELPDPGLSLRRQMLVSRLFTYVSEIQELEDGYAFKLRRSAFLARRIAEYLLFEGRYSPELTFMMIVEPNCRTVWLHVRASERGKGAIMKDCIGPGLLIASRPIYGEHHRG